MKLSESSLSTRKIVNFTIVVAALGYFVDIYDLVLFGIVRRESLQALGVAADQMLAVGGDLLSWQMTGMLVGGIIWGVLGDKRGRISVLFGSIFLYSAANIANAFVTSIGAYSACRLFAGIGLAGELGAAITLVTEIMPKETRGYGTAIVASVGILGAVAANLVGKEFTWSTAYIIGGALGLVLLVMRISIYESGMYDAIRKRDVPKGQLNMLFTSGKRFVRYLRCIMIGIPLWYVVGILMFFAPELSTALGIADPISAGDAVMYCYIGLAVGDLASGFLSQFMRSRRKVIFIFLSITTVMIFVYFFSRGVGSTYFYTVCTLLGIGAGYWAVFVTTAAEQFGTNLRATVATTVPNFVRGSITPLIFMRGLLLESTGPLWSALIVGLVCIVLAYIALAGLEESYHKDLDFLETS